MTLARNMQVRADLDLADRIVRTCSKTFGPFVELRDLIAIELDKARAAEREACAKMLDDLAREARTARDNYAALGNAGMDAQRHDNRASAYAAGANAIRSRGTTT